MNVPWTGFPLKKMLEAVKPKSSAKFIKFTTAENRKQMLGINWAIQQGFKYPWPYHEALRMDEAMNELVLMATGIYGQPHSGMPPFGQIPLNPPLKQGAEGDFESPKFTNFIWGQ